MKKMSIAAAVVLAVAFSGCKPKDADIQKSLQAKEPAGITVSVTSGVASLNGEVADEAAKAGAEKIAADEKGVKSVSNNLTVHVEAPVFTPPVIAADDPLAASVKDAVKDHPTVTASVADGVIMLTGSIKKADLPKLMMNLQSLHPKKVDNKLTIN